MTDAETGRIAFSYGHLARLALGPAFALVLTSLVGCETAKPAMTLEEARTITASFTSPSFAPPPRAITDIRLLLTPRGVDYRISSFLLQADRPPPLSEDRLVLGQWFFERGRAARRLLRIRQAIDDFTRAAEYVKPGQAKVRGFYGADPSTVASWMSPDLGMIILQDLADTYAAAGDHWNAIAAYEKAIVSQSSVPYDSGRLVFMYADLAALHAASGDLKAADRALGELVRREAEFRFNGWGGGGQERQAAYTARGEAAVAMAQASVLEVRGLLSEAERLWRRSIDLLLPFATRDFWAAPIDARLGRLALCLLRQGRLLEAEVEVRKALRSAVARPDSYSFDVASLLTTLARVLREQGRYADAQLVAKETIRLYEEGMASPRSSPSVTAPHRELASAFVAQGQWAAALAEFAVFRERLQDERLYRRLTEDDPTLAIALLRSGRIDEAAELLGPALDRSRRIRGDRHPSTAEVRGLGAILLAARGDASTARKEFAAATTVLLNNAEHVDDESTSQGELAQRRTWVLSEYIDLLSRTRDPGATPSEGDAVAEAFRIADGARGGIVQRALSAAIARSAAATPALGDLARREQDAAKQIAALHGLLATMDDRAKGAEADLRRRIEALQRARQALIQEIERKFPAYTGLINPRPATIERARAVLRPGEALLATYVGEERTYVWAVPQTGPVAFAVVPLGASAIGASVATLRKALDSGARTLQDVPAFDVGVAHELYRQILEPVRAGWEPASSLLVVAHGPLAQIPWTLLPRRAVPLGPERAPLFSNYRAIPWLVRTHAVTVVPSVSTLAALRALPPADPQRRPFVGFGDPYFSVAHARQGSADRVAALSERGGLTLRDVVVSPGADVQESRLAMLPRLPDTAEEILAMARTLGADEARDVFLGVAANERAVRTLDLSRYRVIAFATHGLMPGDIDGLTQPALALTAPEVASVDGDGLLTMEKILALRLNADWVVLSACNTANGAGTGAEAISGLGQAFFYAGARALLVTLWPVETTSAKTLTTELFRRQGADAALTRPRALQQTINAMIDDGGLIDPSTGRMAFSYAHPIFWAPFVLVGDGG